jgi:hypothetical protein
MILPKSIEKNKNNSKVTVALLLSLATIMVVATVTTPLTALASRSEFIDPTSGQITTI